MISRTAELVIVARRGARRGLTAVPILVVWLHATLVLAGRRSGYVIILLGSLLGLAAPVVHCMVPGGVVHGDIAKSSGAFFFVWTMIALGVSALFSVVLSARGLLSRRSGEPR